MIRRIIKIDQEKCNGCGLCVKACHEQAIGISEGKATLIKDDYCDGLGDCLPSCPMDAISFEEREAAPYDEEAVQARISKKNQILNAEVPKGCPGSQSKTIDRTNMLAGINKSMSDKDKASEKTNITVQNTESRLTQWPVQIKLAPVNAPYFNGAKLLIAADCTAYAYAKFHEDFIKNHITLIGCPKLDMGDYSEKLTEIIRNNDIKSVKVVRMEVPCCGGIERAVIEAMKNSGKFIPWQVVTIGTAGNIIED